MRGPENGGLKKKKGPEVDRLEGLHHSHLALALGETTLSQDGIQHLQCHLDTMGSADIQHLPRLDNQSTVSYSKKINTLRDIN